MNDRLSLAIVCFPSLGGSGVVASELAKGLAERGHEVHLLSTDLPGRIQREVEGLHFHPVAVPTYPLLEHAPYGLALASRLLDLCAERRIDLVQVHYAVPHAASAFLARELAGAGGPRIVVSLHGTDVTHVGSHPAYRTAVRALLAASDGITVPSHHLREEARRRFGLGEEVAIEVLANFVDTDLFRPPERRDPSLLHRLFPDHEEGPILFHVSNFRAVKRTGDLVEVLHRLRHDVPARLVLVGDGPERSLVEERAAALGLSRRIAFLGEGVPFAELLGHADAFVLTSESESFGLAAVEAMSCGVPVCAWAVGGLVEVVGEEAGRLAAPYDVEALACAIREVVSDREARSRGARNRAIERYRREPALDRFESFFRRVLAGGERERGRG